MTGHSRVVFGTLLLVGFCCFLLFEVSTITHVSVSGVSKPKEGFFNYVSKRRVPSGPDPIHNRKVGNAREPPERV